MLKKPKNSFKYYGLHLFSVINTSITHERINEISNNAQTGADSISKRYMRKVGSVLAVGALGVGLVIGTETGWHKMQRGRQSNLDNERLTHVIGKEELAKFEQIKKNGTDETWSELARDPKTSSVNLDWIARNVDDRFVLTKSIIAGREDIIHTTLEYLSRPQENTTIKLQVVYNHKVATLDDLSLLSKDSSILIRNAAREELTKRKKK